MSFKMTDVIETVVQKLVRAAVWPVQPCAAEALAPAV